MSAEAFAEMFAEASSAGGAISMNCAGVDILSGARAVAGAKVAV